MTLATRRRQNRPATEAEAPPRTRFRLEAKHVVMASMVGVVAYFALVPLAYLAWSAFYDGTGWTLEYLKSAAKTDGLLEMVKNSAIFGIGSTLLSLGVGTGLAYVLARTDVPARRGLFVCALIPMIIPGILHTISWVFLASPRTGLINVWLEPVFGPGFLNIYSMGGMIFVEGIHLAPLVFLLMYAAFKNIDASLEEAAIMSGAKRFRLARSISLPLVKPALAAAALIMVVRVLGTFEVPVILGMPERIWVVTSKMWSLLSDGPGRYGEASVFAVFLLVVTTVGVFWQSRLGGNDRSYQTLVGKGFRPDPMELGGWRWPVFSLVITYFILAAGAPLAILLYVSLEPYYATPSLGNLSALSLDNYRETLNDPRIAESTVNSLFLSVGTATLVMFVSAIVAWVVVKTRIRGRWLIDNLAFLPLAIPGLILGLALMFFYLRSPLPIYGTIWILLIAYFTLHMPYGMRYASASMYQISGELEEASETSGASWWKTFRRINLPLLAPGLLAGWLYIMMVCVRELAASLLLYSPNSQVLSIVIWGQWTRGELTQLASLGVLMVLFLIVLTTLSQRIGSRIGGIKG